MNKEILLDLLAKEDETVLTQAYLYAKNLTNYGVDISKRWSTVTEQNAALEKAYLKGKFDAMNENMTTAKMEMILAREMAYLYLNADYWFYIINDKSCYNMNVDAAIELKHVINALGLDLKEIIKTAKEIYDWVRDDGHDVDLVEIKEKHQNFCDPITKKRKLILK